MSFRGRMIVLAAGAVAIAIVIASVLVYVITRNELSGQLDASLRATVAQGQPQAVHVAPSLSVKEVERLATRAPSLLGPNGSVRVHEASGSTGGFASGSELATEAKSSMTTIHAVPGAAAETRTSKDAHGETVTIERKTVVVPRGSLAKHELATLQAASGNKLVLPPQRFGGTVGYVQLSQPNGNVLSVGHGSRLPITAAAHAVAAGRRGAFFSEVKIDGTPARLLTERGPSDSVWFVAQPLASLDDTLDRLRLVLAIVSLSGIALAVALGLFVSRAALVPVRRLTRAAERVARTQDLGHRIEAGKPDELGRLSASFNTMLAALERSRLAQRQLISDASHELRTPLTSMQANLDVLALGERLPAGERARILAAAQTQLRELGVLVGDLVDLSKNEIEELELEHVRLDLASAAAIERARGHAPGCQFVLDAEPCLVHAAPARLDRAIANLLDNAVKWNPQGEGAGPIEVRVHGGRLEVRDHGPGIAEQDLPRVFDRFYRAPAARGRPGSGLGLAIVRQMAETHGGTVYARNDPGGGAWLTLELPAVAMTDEDLAAPLGQELQQAPRPL